MYLYWQDLWNEYISLFFNLALIADKMQIIFLYQASESIPKTK